MSDYRKRSTAIRVLSKELNLSSEVYKKNPDDDMSPLMLSLPSGGEANRLLVTGTLLNFEETSNGNGYWRATVSDGSGSNALAFASEEYQGNVVDSLKKIDAPDFVSMVGKVNHYEPDDDTTIVSVKPEAVRTVDERVRNYRIFDSAKKTLERLSSENEKRDSHYDESTKKNLFESAVDTLENITGSR